MLGAIKKSFEALKDGYFWKIIFFSLILTISLFVSFVGGITFSIAQLGLEDWWVIGPFVAWLGGTAAVVMGYFFAPLVFPIITRIFVEGIARHIEQKHYPDRAAIEDAAFFKTLPADLKFLLVTIIANILVLPFYFIPVINLFVYYLLNGYLFGREYFEMVALRHLERDATKRTRKNNRIVVLTSGILITLMFTTPFLNLVAPVIATIFMVHIFHSTAVKPTK